MMIFEKAGKENTAAAAAIAVEKAKELGCGIVLSSNTGASAEAVLSQAAAAGFAGKIVVVRNATNAARKGVNLMSGEVRESLEKRGCTVVGAANALSAGERSLSTKFQGVYPLEIMAHTLRMFGQGMKVCVECATMAMDADALPFQAPVVALGGTGTGLDTAVVLTPSYSSSVLDTRIHEVLCSPGCTAERRKAAMILFFCRREVFLTWETAQWNQVCEILRANKINYTTRISSMGSPGRYRGVPGIRMEFTCQYRVFIHKRDYELALHLIRAGM